MSDPSDSVILRASGVVKRFPGVRALAGVNFELRRGEVHALLGENGAGKSTLIKVLTGVYPPDEGSITLDGKSINPKTPRDAERLGISTVYQEVSLIPQVSVAENLSLGCFPTTFGMIRWRSVARLAEESLRRLGIRIDVSRPLNSYSIAIQQMVAIARAVGTGKQSTKVLILDEPTSSLDADEVTQLFTVMDQLRRDGLGIVFVTHFLEQVYRISDRITILRNGAFIGQWPTSELPRLSLVGAMVGKDLTQTAPVHSVHPSAVSGTTAKDDAIRIQDLAKRGTLEPVSLEIHKGTTMGLAGLLGSGRTEAARLIFGSVTADSGHVELGGVPYRFRAPSEAIDAGLAMTSEDRKATGIFPNLSIRENIVIATQSRRGIWRRITTRDQAAIAARYVASMGIKAPSIEQPISELSGGNQQKCILARWLATRPVLLILDEPTRGIDVGAKAEVRRLIDALCADGMSVLFISSELDEVAEVCDRVVVLRDRRQVGELSGEAVTSDSILRLIAHPADQSAVFIPAPGGADV